MDIRITQSNRNFGIDILRMLAMYFVVIGHVLAKGNVLNSTLPFSLSYELLWALKIVSMCAVNTFGIISGYVGYKHGHRLASWVFLWFKVIVYSFGITVLFYVLDNSITVVQLIKSAFPVVGGEYWYFNAYLGCCVLVPLIDTAVENTSKEQLKVASVIGFLLFSVIGTISIHDVFTMEYGYSVLWLSILYFIGAVIKKYDQDLCIRKSFLLWGFVCCVTLQWGIKCAIELLTYNVLGEVNYGNVFNEYTSPLIIGMAVILVLLFKQFSIREEQGKIATGVAERVFFVYIIHMHPIILANFIQNRYKWIAEKNGIVAFLLVLTISGVIFISAFSVDGLFSIGLKKLGIKIRLKKIEDRFFVRR